MNHFYFATTVLHSPLARVFVLGRYEDEGVPDELAFDVLIFAGDEVLHTPRGRLVLLRDAQARVRVHLQQFGRQVLHDEHVEAQDLFPKKKNIYILGY